MESSARGRRGNRFGLWFFRTLIIAFGLPAAYSWLHVVCLHYLLFDSRARKAAMAYVRRRFPGRGWWWRMGAVYRLLVSQGIVLIDRFYLLAGRGRFDIEVRGRAELEKWLAGGRGFVLLTAHVGSWQVAMTEVSDIGRTVHLLMRPEDNRAVQGTLDMYGAREGIKVISTDGHLGGVVECVRAIAGGEIVSVMGDKAYGAGAADAEFLGGTVRMPFGAFAIAQAAGCPVVVLLTTRTGLRKYLVDFSNVIRPAAATSREKRREMNRCVQEFARILEAYVGAHPYQWFVFEDLWDYSHTPSRVAANGRH